jgi:hypothetical protein
LVAGCARREDAGLARKKLDVIVASDLKAIIGELPSASLRDSVYSRVVEYETYTQGMYGVRAVLDFYYMRGVHVKRTVKYRYLVRAGKWERYENEYQFYSDSAAR